MARICSASGQNKNGKSRGGPRDGFAILAFVELRQNAAAIGFVGTPVIP
jgi:hypothetical protein